MSVLYLLHVLAALLLPIGKFCTKVGCDYTRTRIARADYYPGKALMVSSNSWEPIYISFEGKFVPSQIFSRHVISFITDSNRFL